MPSGEPEATGRDGRPSSDRRLRASRAAIAMDALILALFLIAVAVGGWSLRPPEVVPSDAPAEVFSAARAEVHLKVITAEPHPVGSAAHARVRAYLEQVLRDYGLEVQTLSGLAGGAFGYPLRPMAEVHNLLARLPGRASSGGVLLCAHYDSVARSFGAGDDGAGVAAILETVRALKSSAPERDVWILLTDGEELTMLGAQVALPRLQSLSIEWVLNFEALGLSGPSLLFESVADKTTLRRVFHAAPQLAASSLSDEIYKLLPYDTDFSILRKAGFKGFNFAFIEDTAYNHLATDARAFLDLRSLQHHGALALALTRELAGADEQRVSPEERTGEGADPTIFFDVLSRTAVLYSRPVGGCLGLGGLLGWLWLGWRMHRRGRTRGPEATAVRERSAFLPGLGWASLWILLSFLGGGGVSTLVVSLADLTWTTHGASLLFGAAALWALAAMWEALRQGERKGADPCLFCWLVLGLQGALGIVALVWAPGASFLFTWPELLGLSALSLRVERPKLTDGGRLLSALAWSGGVLFLVPLLHLVQQALSVGMLEVSTGLLMLLVWPTLAGLSTLLQADVGRRWGTALLLTVSGGMVATALLPSPSEARPQADGLWYVQTLPEQQLGLEGQAVPLDSLPGSSEQMPGVWMTEEARPSAWMKALFAAGPEVVAAWSWTPWLKDKVRDTVLIPLPSLPPPELQLLKDEVEGEQRVLTLRMRSSRGAQELVLMLEPGTETFGSSVQGMVWTEPQGEKSPSRALWGVAFQAPPDTGIEVQVRVRAGEALRFVLADRSDGLPTFPSGISRPPFHIASAAYYAESTYISRPYTLGK